MSSYVVHLQGNLHSIMHMKPVSNWAL